MPPHKLISLSLYPAEVELLDALVERIKVKAFNPKKVNRSTVIRTLVANAVAELNKEEEVS